MLIKNIEDVNRFKQAKLRIYRLVRDINSSFEPVNLIYLLLLNILLIVPFTSILYKSIEPFPSPIPKTQRLLLIPDLFQQYGLSSAINDGVGIGLGLTITILTLLHFTFTSVFPFFTKILSGLLKFSHYFCVPLTDLALTSFSSIWTGSSIVSSIISLASFTLLLVSLVIVMVTVKLDIRMLRKKNSLWNLQNQVHLYGYLFLIFKTGLISRYGINISVCLLSLAFWVFHRKMPKACVCSSASVIDYSIYNYIFATDLGVFVFLATSSQILAFNVWAIGMCTFLFQSFLAYYKKSHSKLYLPACASQPQQFYNFFYCFKEQSKGEDTSQQNNDGLNAVYHLHRINCRADTCRLGPNLDNNNDLLEDVVWELISSKKNTNISNRIVAELWNLEMGKKCQVETLLEKTIDTKQDFMINSIDHLTKDSEVTMKNSQSNKNVISKVFYDLIFEISVSYSQFYQELARVHPKIDNLVRLGCNIRKKVDKLRGVYSELLKSNMINFKMIELYLQFFTNFVNENVMNKESVGRLMKVQQHMHFQDIAQNYKPTLTIYPQSGNVQNANAQAQKYFQSTRFQLKYRNISDLLCPSISLQKLRTIMGREQREKDDDSIYSFIKKSDKEYGTCRILLSERYIKQKKLIILQIVKEPFSQLKNFILVDGDFKVKLMLRTQVKIKIGLYKSNPLTLQWSELFETYVSQQVQKLMRTKMAKISLDYKGCTLIVKKMSTMAENAQLLMAQLIISNENSRDKKQSILMNRTTMIGSSPFQFHCSEQDALINHKVMIYGLKQGSLGSSKRHALLKNNTINEKELHSMIVDQNLNTDKIYGAQIKTYRLFDGELYNVDLQDKEAYNGIFEEHISEKKQNETDEKSTVECYIFLGVLLLGIGLVIFSVILIINFQSSITTIGSYYNQYENIQSFSTDFQRILCILRDFSSSFLNKFPNFSMETQIGQSYNRIQALKNETLFDSTQFTISFQNLTMTGTLNQLMDVMLAHISEVLDTKSLAITSDIQKTCVQQLNNMISSSQSAINSMIYQTISNINTFKDTVLYTSIGIIFLLYCLMILYCLRSNSRAKDKLSDLMYISDSEVRMLQDNSERMRYAVQMARKNFDIDTQNLLATNSDFKKRKNPKEAQLSSEIVYAIIGLTICGLALHMTCLFLFSQQISTSLSTFSTFHNQSITITSPYHMSAELSNQIAYQKKLDQYKLNLIRSNFSHLMNSHTNLLMSTDLSNLVVQYYFYNSSTVVQSKYGVTPAECRSLAPEFTVINPFEVGVCIYMVRQDYYMSNNLTQTFAHTSIYSRHFARIYTNFTSLMKQQSTLTLNEASQLITILSVIMIVIDVSYLFIFLIIYRYFREQLTKIKEILFFFGNKLKHKKHDEEASKDMVRSSKKINSQTNEEEEELMGTKKRRTSMDVIEHEE